MIFDVEIPTCREAVFVPEGFGGPMTVVETTVAAERLGYNAVWATDFLTPTPEYGLPADAKPAWYEPMISLAYCAARTRTIKLGTGVLLVPLRDPVILAKEIATLDQFSNGRFLLGMGLGMCRDEYVAVRPRDRKARRGTLLNECVEILHLLLDKNSDKVSYKGEYNEFNGVRLDPKPVQQPLPMYVPGRTPEALERIVKFDLGIMVGAAQAKERLEALKPIAEKHGKDFAKIDVIAEGEMRLAPTRDRAIADYTASQQGIFRVKIRGAKLEQVLASQWIGTPAEIVDKINAVARAGLTHFNVLHIAGDTMAERMEQMEMFAKDVMPHIKA
jgi:probable F420-dependent oxidoreductase